MTNERSSAGCRGSNEKSGQQATLFSGTERRKHYIIWPAAVIIIS